MSVVGPRIGSTEVDGGTLFRVWAPRADRVALVLGDARSSRVMEAEGDGYHALTVDDAPPMTRYAFSLDGGEARPDPASRSQPDGVHAFSEVVSSRFAWTDGAWRNRALAEQVFYELHVGTFTGAGTFDGVVERLEALVDLGVTAIELMPVASFPGSRNWGYDGVCPFAAQASYGGPEGLRRLVDAAHGRGLGVILDVVYNHLGPEGNYLRAFGPYFTDRYSTPWGEALNFDGRGSDHVRSYFIQNALWWIDEMHVDGLRLDAVHAIVDESARPFVAELAEAVHRRAGELGRRVHVIAESAANDPRVVRGREVGGFGCDGQWNDDFHHALRSVLTGEREGYYAAFGRLSQLADAYRRGFVYVGQHSVSFGRRHGAPTDGIGDDAFVVFAQNHDQVGNRMLGERLGASVDLESLKLAAAATVLSPFVPLLFMGEEWAASAPFQYFVSHTDEALIEAVRKGRREEFASFAWDGEAPDPQAVETFERSRLDWDEADRGEHAIVRGLYRRLIGLRSRLGLGRGTRSGRRVECDDAQGTLVVRRAVECGEAVLVMNFAREGRLVGLESEVSMESLLDTADAAWGGPGAGASPSEGEPGILELALAPRSARLLVTEGLA